MRKTTSFSTLIVILFMGSCIAPVNSVYDTARMLDKKESRVGLNYSRYYGYELNLFDEEDEGFANYNNNIGFAFGYGLSDNISLGIRYEYLKSIEEFEFLGETFPDYMNYFEFGCKLRIIEDRLALGLPAGFYLYDGSVSTYIHPRLLFTLGNSKKLDFTIAPNLLLAIDDGIDLSPGICLGMGISNNLDKWAVRPEFGFNGSFCFGFGTYFNFSPISK